MYSTPSIEAWHARPRHKPRKQSLSGLPTCDSPRLLERYAMHRPVDEVDVLRHPWWPGWRASAKSEDDADGIDGADAKASFPSFPSGKGIRAIEGSRHSKNNFGLVLAHPCIAPRVEVLVTFPTLIGVDALEVDINSTSDQTLRLSYFMASCRRHALPGRAGLHQPSQKDFRRNK